MASPPGPGGPPVSYDPPPNELVSKSAALLYAGVLFPEVGPVLYSYLVEWIAWCDWLSLVKDRRSSNI